MSNLKEIISLRNEILKHDELYDKGAPIITDTAYDKLYAKLIHLEKLYPEFHDSKSPTQRIVSRVVDGLQKVTHSTPMLSQDKIHTAEDIRKFCSKADIKKGIIVQFKLDGLTVVEKYSDNIFKQGISRGDGYVGEDLSHTVVNAKGLPLTIPFGGNLEVRSEAVIDFADFHRINTNGNYKSPRNLVSGTVRTLDSSKAKERGVRIISYDLISSDTSNFSLDTQMLEFLKAQGFDVVPYEVFYNVDDLIEYCTSFNEKIRPTLPYMIDGLVLKYNDLAIREKLGYTSKFPRWGCAFKFESEDATTKLIDVIWQVGKTGILTPVANLEAATIDGVTITKASLANIDDIRNRDIRIGDTVLLVRANDVIPKVISVVKELRDGSELSIQAPEVCPVCGHTISTVFNKESKKTTFYCENTNCSAQLERKLQHYVSRNCMNIDGMGTSSISLFIENGIIGSLLDIYELQNKLNSIHQLEGFGDKKITKILDSIEKTKKAPLSKVLYALSINNIGESGAKDLAKEFKSMDAILELNKEELFDRVSKIKDFGDVCSSSFASFFSDLENIQVINSLKEQGLTMCEEVTEISDDSCLLNKTFVITGTLSISRKDMQSKIENLGGKVTGSVSKKTDYLLLGGGEEGSSKHKKAVSLNVPIISEDDLDIMIS